MPEASPGNLVCDLDGVIYLAGTGVPGAGAALSEIAGRGYRVLFATNAALRTVEEVAARIDSLTGYPAQPDQVVTSAVAATTVLGAIDSPILTVGEPGLGESLRRAGLALTDDPLQARTVVAGLDRGFDYDRLRLAMQAVRNGARLLGTNSDTTYPTPEGPWPGGGAIVAAIEAASGRTAEFAGKPFRPMQEAVGALLGPGPTWMVGDRPETDLALARACSWIGVLVLTGIVTDPAEVEPQYRPDHVLPSIREVPELLP